MARAKKNQNESSNVSRPSVLVGKQVNKVRFLVWFTGALDSFSGVKAHHLHTVRAYFTDLGLGDPESVETYDQGLMSFGYTKKI